MGREKLFFMKRKIFLFLAIVSVVGMIAISGCKKKETYTVTFNPNGGTGTMVAQTFTEDETQALTSNSFTRESHTFFYWNTVQDGTGTTYTDGQTIAVTADMTLYAQWKIVPQWVDLGLPSGTKWATFNVGASSPEEYGNYFAWGETSNKETYNWSTYKYCNGEYNTLTKYCNNAEYGSNGFTDTLTTLIASDDAATTNWGADWRMPTREEMNELYSNCTQEWTTQNGVNGRMFTGINGNYIFLPAAGACDDSALDGVGFVGDYLCSSLIMNNPIFAFGVSFNSDRCYMCQLSRNWGVSVRPVCMSAQN